MASNSRIAPTHHACRTRLDAGWSIARVDAGTAETPEQLTADVAWVPAADTLNATVTAIQMRAQSGTSWLAHNTASHEDASDWWFRCEFEHASVPNTSTFLLLDGIATFGDVWLNGQHILSSRNMFLSHEIDVSAHLRAENVLYIRCASLRKELTKRRARPAWRTKLTDQQQLRWIRTTLLGRMPGWSSSPQIVGAWRPVALETRDAIVHVDALVMPRLDGATGVIDFDVQMQLRDATLAHEPTATVAIGESEHTIELRREGDILTAAGTVTVPRAERWWPHTHGAQHRYDFVLTVTVDHQTVVAHTDRIAFRSIELDTADGNFMLSVNGTRIFCRGACWTSANGGRGEGTREEYADALQLARDAGMNMLRVGGTMTYEADAFYDLCDDMGILVWQDFMFANMDYPFGDSDFLAQVHEEVQQFLRRTQTRASIAILCGNSEIEQQASMLGLPPEKWSAPFFKETLPQWCATERPDLPYWRSSPSGGAFPFHVNAGDAHYFGFGPYLRSFDDVKTSGVRFASETLAFAHVPDWPTIDLLPCGPNGAGHHPDWKAGVARDNGASWDFEDVRDHYVAEFFGVNPATLRYSDPQRYLALGRVTSGEAIARTMGQWRRATSTCNGALLWFYKDLRVGAGWGVVDITNRPKAAYYFFKRAAQAIAIFLADDGLNGMTITTVNETDRLIDAEVRLTLYRHGEVVVATATAAQHLPPRASAAIQADTLLDGFVDLSYAYRFGPPNHDLIVATLADRTSHRVLSEAFAFPVGFPTHREHDLGVTASAQPIGDGRYTLCVTSRRFAQAITIDVDHFLPDDNYFNLAPGASREIILRPLRADRVPSGTVEPLNATSPTAIVVA